MEEPPMRIDLSGTPFTSLPILALTILAGCGTPNQEGLAHLGSYDFEEGSEGLAPKMGGDWQVAEEDGSMVYQLLSPGEFGEIRAPTSWSLLEDHPVRSFVFTGRLKCHTEPEVPARDMLVLFHFRDPTHFYYVHFSASSDQLHNIIGLVNGADRIKVNREPPGESVFRLTDAGWHDFKVTFDSETGEIRAFLDDMETPILTARDTILGHGLVGIGSFDDTGSFDDLELWGVEEGDPGSRSAPS
jgi:hypothetical protein